MKKTRIIIIAFFTLLMTLMLGFGVFISVNLFFGKSVDTSALTSDFDDFIYAYENDSISRDIIDGLELGDIVFKIAEDGSTYTLDFEITNTSDSEAYLDIQVYANEECGELLETSSALLTTKTSEEDVVLLSGQSHSMSRTSLILCDVDELEEAFSYVYVEIIYDIWHCRIMVPVTL